MKKVTKILLSSTLALLMILTTVVGVSASGNIMGTPTSPAQLYITSHLERTAQTANMTGPVTFDFHFESHQPVVGQPAIPNSSVTFNPSDFPATPTNHIYRATLTTGNLLPAVAYFPHAGIFEYRVTQTTTFVNTPTELVLVDTQTYHVLVIIASHNGELYVRGVGVHEVNQDGTPGSKVYPELPGVEGAIAFRNVFVRTTPDVSVPQPPAPPVSPDPGPYPDPELPGVPGAYPGALIVRSAVRGDFADVASTFIYTGEVRIPALIHNAPGNIFSTVHAWVYRLDADTGFFVRTAQHTFAANPTSGTIPFTVTLRGDEALVFDRLPHGSEFEVQTSRAVLAYRPRIDLWTNGIGRGGIEMPATAPLGTVLSTNDIGTPPHYVGIIANNAIFTNIHSEDNDIPITGLLMNNLPVMLVGIAGIGFFGMVVANKKRRSYE